MGHTFCAAPSSDTVHIGFEDPDQRSKPQQKPLPRSSGVPGTWSNWGRSVSSTDSRNLKRICEIYEDSSTLAAIREVLVTEAPVSTGAGQQRRRRRTLRISSRRLKQMLLSRHSTSPRMLMAGVAPRVTAGGKRYAQITAPAAEGGDGYGRGEPSVFYGQGYEAVGVEGGCGNPSVYRVNEIRDEKGHGREKGKGGGTKRWSLISSTDEEDGGSKESWLSAAQKKDDEKKPEGSLRKEFLAPIPLVENGDSYYLGITDDDLLPTADDEESDRIYHPEPLLPPPLNLGNEEKSNVAGFGSNAFPRFDFQARAAQATQASQGHNDSAVFNGTPRRHEGRKSSPRVVKLSPATHLRSQSQAGTPCTPRHSIDKTRKEARTSPTVNDRARAPSAYSAHGSVVGGGQTEASVGIPTMARSAEVLRPGYYDGEIHKFPRPGPAPTTALPSLPEGQSSRTSIVLLPSVGPEPAMAMPSAEPSPRSPAKKDRFSPMDDVMSEDTAGTLRRQRRSDSRPQTAQSCQSEQAHKGSLDVSSESAVVPGSTTARSQKLNGAEWQEKRTRSRRELKLRDVDRVRSQRNSLVGAAQASAGGTETRKATHSRMAATASGSELHPLSESSSSGQPRSSSLGWKSAETECRSSHHPSSALSPVLVVAEQQPSRPTEPLVAPNILPKSRRSSRKRHARKEAYPHSRPPSPSFPSSDEGSTCRTQRTRVTESRRRSNSQAASTPRSSFPIQDMEARFEARIVELEKKNAQLLNAFIAVINTSSGSAASSLTNGRGSSGSSGRPSSGVSGQRSSGQSVSKENNPGGISELYAPLEEVASKLSRMS